MGKSLRKGGTVGGKIPQGGGADEAFSVRGVISDAKNREQGTGSGYPSLSKSLPKPLTSQPPLPNSPFPTAPCQLRTPNPYSRLHTPCSLFPIPCSLFPIPCSLFPIPCPLFPIPNSLFPIPCSLFPVPYSLFPVPSCDRSLSLSES